MTTIAYDGKTLATDSLTTAGNTAFGCSVKIHKIKGGHVALCGDASFGPAIIAFLNGGPKPELGENADVGGLVVYLDGTAKEFNKDLRLFPACLPWAGGSGESFALAALALGHTAVEAIELACLLDIYSRGPVQKVELWT